MKFVTLFLLITNLIAFIVGGFPFMGHPSVSGAFFTLLNAFAAWLMYRVAKREGYFA